MIIKTVRLLTSALFMSSTILLISCGGDAGSNAKPEADSRVDFNSYAGVRDYNPSVSVDTVNQWVESINTFGIELFRKSNSYDDNLLVIAEARVNTIALLLAASSGQTEEQLLASLGTSLSAAQIHVAMNQLDLGIRQNNLDAVWGRSRAAWGQTKYLFSKSYLETIVENYGVELSAAEFRGETTDLVVQDVHLSATNWAEEQSDQRADWPLPESSINARSRIVLAESQRQDLTWAVPCSAIDDGRFKRLSGYQITTPLISCVGWMGRYQDDDLVAVNIPLTDSALELLVIVPREDKFERVASRLESVTLSTIYHGLNYLESQVTFPAMHLSQRVDLLAEETSELGEREADLSAVNELGYLFVNAWQLNAQFEFAASGISSGVTSGLVLMAEEDEPALLFSDYVINGLMMTSPTPGPPQYDTPPQAWPSILILRDSVSGVMLLVGQIAKPAGAVITSDRSGFVGTVISGSSIILTAGTDSIGSAGSISISAASTADTVTSDPSPITLTAGTDSTDPASAFSITTSGTLTSGSSGSSVAVSSNP
jgi:serine protease inhibitor